MKHWQHVYYILQVTKVTIFTCTLMVMLYKAMIRSYEPLL